MKIFVIFFIAIQIGVTSILVNDGTDHGSTGRTKYIYVFSNFRTEGHGSNGVREKLSYIVMSIASNGGGGPKDKVEI